MSDKQHKGQLQVVEGSPTGEFHVIPKFAYDIYFNLEYLAEAKIGKSDHVNAHYIQKFVYDASCNMTRILIATNLTNCDCTDVSIDVINGITIKISTTTGDFVEVNEGDSFNLTTPTQKIVGLVAKREDDTTVVVTLSEEDLTLVDETDTSIAVTDLTVKLNHKNTKEYDKRRWDHRERYFYETN